MGETTYGSCSLEGILVSDCNTTLLFLADTNSLFDMSWEALGLVSIAGNLTPEMVSLQLCIGGERGGRSLAGGAFSIKSDSWEVEGQSSELVLPW